MDEALTVKVRREQSCAIVTAAGEIALLRRIPRTASVTAMSRLEVRTLAREEFLAGVTGNPESVERAEDVVSTRLQAG